MLDTTTTATTRAPINGIDLAELDRTVAAIVADPDQAQVAFRVKTEWTGQTRSESLVESYTLAGVERPRRFKVVADEPDALLGSNTAPNPQELLMAALNACMMVGYVANAAIRGITLESCEIAVEGELDLRGFLGLDQDVPPGYRRLDYHVRIRGDGTPEQFEQIHRAVMESSPNHFNLNKPIPLHGTLEVLSTGAAS